MSAPGIRQFNSTKPLPGLQIERRCFTVVDGDEMFGLPVQSVQTIFRIEGVTPVPLGPADVEGLVNLRGRIVTAVSLKRRLAKAPLDSARGTLAIGIEHDGENFALIVDDVGDVTGGGDGDAAPVQGVAPVATALRALGSIAPARASS